MALYSSPEYERKFKLTGLSVLEKSKIDFQVSQLRFPIGTILATFDLTSHPDTSYQVSSLFIFQFRRSSK